MHQKLLASAFIIQAFSFPGMLKWQRLPMNYNIIQTRISLDIISRLRGVIYEALSVNHKLDK